MNMLQHAAECRCSCHCWRSDGHWLLLVADLGERCFLVYDSLPSPAAKSVRELVDSAVSCLCVLWLGLELCVGFEPT